MADIDAQLYNWSTDPNSNAPTDATVVGSGLDDNLRQIQATARMYLASNGGNLASAATLDLASNHAMAYDVTGATTITGLGTVAAGIFHWLRFTSTPLIKYNAASLILPSAGDIQAAAGDCAYVESLGGGNWLCRSYTRSDGTPLRSFSATVAVSSNTTLGAFASPQFVLVSATADVTLPAASAVPVGAPLIIKSITTGKVRILPNGTDQIDSVSAARRMPAYDSWELRSNASIGWYIVRRGRPDVGDFFVGGYTTAPQYGLKPDGSAVSRATYAGLFDAIGTSFGAGDGSSTFNLPNLLGRIPIGVGQGNTAEGGGTGTNRTLGASGGAETHVQTLAELAAHTHGIGTPTTLQTGPSSLNVANPSAAVLSTSTGSSSPMAIMNPFLAVQFYIQL